MGASHSSNVANAISDVTNYVTNSTVAGTQQVQEITQKITLDNCTIKASGNVTIAESANTGAVNTQIVKAINNNSLLNNIAQKMMQSAKSKVGTLGIGYADANNTTNETVDTTNQVINAMKTSAEQFSNTSQNETCINSTIEAANVAFTTNSASQYLSEQTLDQNNITDIVNQIQQTADQKATATVEGLGMLAFLLIIAFAVIVWALTKPLDTKAAKSVVGIGMVALTVILVSLAYIKNLPPLFAEPSNCINGSNMGCSKECVNKSSQSIRLNAPPLKYKYDLIPGGHGTSNLLQMAIAANAGDNPKNGGYTIQTMNNTSSVVTMMNAKVQSESLDLTALPELLYNPSSTTGQYYQIPPQYDPTQSSQAISCTPKILQVGGNETDVNRCPDNMSPTYWSAGMMTTSAPDGLAQLNDDAWANYINTAKSAGRVQDLLYARFVLAKLAGQNIIDLHIYVNDEEFVEYLDENSNVKIEQAKKVNAMPPSGDFDPKHNIYKFTPDQICSWEYGCDSGGSLNGQIGVCNTSQNKFNEFMHKIGSWIMLFIILIAVGLLIRSIRKNNKGE